MKPHYRSLESLILWRDEERPIAWANRFGRSAPLDVEIGFGSGEYLVRLAHEKPTHNFVGIDLEWPSVWRALRNIDKHSIRNVRILQLDARVAMRRLFLPRSINRIHSMFPCPWPKERSAKHRLFHNSFLRLVSNRLVSGGKMEIVTDQLSFKDWILEQVLKSGFSASSEIIKPQFHTKYERKWSELGQNHFFRINLTEKNKYEIPFEEDVELEVHRVDKFDPDRFSPRFSPKDNSGNIHITFKEFIFDEKRRDGMVRVIIAEEGLVQDLWIQIVWKQDKWWIQPARGCGVVPTVGYQSALNSARDAVVQSTSKACV